MSTLNNHNLIGPYNRRNFTNQLVWAGIPIASIDQLARSDQPWLEWLHEDIRKGDTQIREGKRYLDFVAIFCCDGNSVLLSRIKESGGDYRLGGLLTTGRDPRQMALQELGEETPLEVIADRLSYIGHHENVGESRKLPGVLSVRKGEFFKYDAPPLQMYDSREHSGSDGDTHQLIVLPKGTFLADSRVAHDFKDLARKFWDRL